jgi:hypothetical protein
MQKQARQPTNVHCSVALRQLRIVLTPSGLVLVLLPHVSVVGGSTVHLCVSTGKVQLATKW